MIVVIVLSFGVFTFKKSAEIKSVEAKRNISLDGHNNAKDIAKKCIGLFQLDEVGKYEDIKDSIYSYLSDDLKDVYFPKDNIKGVGSPSKLTITDAVSEQISNNEYIVKVEFEEAKNFDLKERKILVGIKNGLIVSMETVI